MEDHVSCIENDYVTCSEEDYINLKRYILKNVIWLMSREQRDCNIFVSIQKNVNDFKINYTDLQNELFE